MQAALAIIGAVCVVTAFVMFLKDRVIARRPPRRMSHLVGLASLGLIIALSSQLPLFVDYGS